MSQELTDFLTSLATDQELVDAFNNDAEGTMVAHNVPEHHRQLVHDKNYTEIQNVLGSDYSISTNHVIRAFKD
jgi:hypothetical protein